jgi:hypothetical protein
MSSEVRFQGRIQKQTYSENDYLLCYYDCLRETNNSHITAGSDNKVFDI